MIPTIRVAASVEELAWQAAQQFIVAAEAAIVATGRFAVALSGGSTPQAMFKLLASEELAGKVDWAKVHILFADERCVPPASPQSNFGVACRLLLDHVPIPYEQIHRMVGEKDPAEAARDYDQLLATHYPDGLDLVLLGMGEDGHTASLFPGTAALAATAGRCVANYVPPLAAWRLTLTADYINRAFEMLILVAGQAKAAMTDRVLTGMGQKPEFPIQMIQPKSGRWLWMMDAPAAGMDEIDESEGQDSEDENDEEALG